jgi:hypothetical protein
MPRSFVLLVIFSLGCRRTPSASVSSVRESHAIERTSSGWRTHLTNRLGQITTRVLEGESVDVLVRDVQVARELALELQIFGAFAEVVEDVA